jgi:hypothetical protein
VRRKSGRRGREVSLLLKQAIIWLIVLIFVVVVFLPALNKAL